jgi:uncharacterized protein involved in exopolysaccharide biosynthesis
MLPVPDASEWTVLPGGGPRPPGRRWALLEERWRTLTAAALLGSFIGFAVTPLLPAWYESTVRLAVIPVDDPTERPSSSAVEGANATVPMLAAILLSRTVADAAAARLRMDAVYATPPDVAGRELLRHVTVSSDRKANMVTVAVEDRLPTRARDLADAVVAEASRRSVELWSARLREHRLNLEAELRQVSARLNGAEEAMRSFREQNHVIDLPIQIKASVEEAAALEKLRIDQDVTLHFLRGFSGNDAIEVRRGLRERNAATRALQALTHGGAVTGALLTLDSLPPLELEHARLKRAIDIEAARFDLVSQKIGQLVAAEAQPGGRPELVDPATLPRRRVRPSSTLMGLEGAIVTTLLAALWVLIGTRRRGLPRAA